MTLTCITTECSWGVISITLDKSEFVGQIGMRMSQRPNMLNDEVDTECLNKCPFLEPIWVCRKGGNEYDFSNTQKTVEVDDLFE